MKNTLERLQVQHEHATRPGFQRSPKARKKSGKVLLKRQRRNAETAAFMRVAARAPTAATAAPTVSNPNPNLSTWRSLDEFSRLQAHQLATLSNENGNAYRFTVNFDHLVKAKAFKAAKGAASYVSNRISDAFRVIEKQLGRPVPWWGVIEFSDTDVMHVHGGLVATDNELVLLGEALLRAAGECSTSAGAGRWFVHLDGYDNAKSYGGFSGPLGWTAYAMKAAKKTAKRLQRSPVITSRSLTQLARALWENSRRGGATV